MTYKTYIFDFDYTLADSSKGIVLCFRHILERHGHEGASDDDIRRTIGMTLEESFTRLCGVTDSNILYTYHKEYEKEADSLMTINTQLFPEVKEVLTKLKAQGAQLAILSTKYRRRIHELVDQEFPEGFFDLIIGGEDVTQLKPHPEGLQKALQQLGADPRQTLYIGDSIVDAQTAQAASVDFAAVLHGVTSRQELEAYPHIAIYTDLRGLIASRKPKRTSTPKKRISLFQIAVLLYFGYMAWDELFVDDGYDFYLFTLLFLVFFSRVAYRRRILPVAWQEWIQLRLQPLHYFLRRVRVRIVRGQPMAPRRAESCRCLSCGEVYVGNYCPRCGQSYRTTRYKLSNALRNIAGGFFNIDSGFGHTVIDLCYRPGHLIREFIGGRRAPYFRPFQMLFILAALYIMSVQLVDPAALQQDSEKKAKSKAETAQVLEQLEKEVDAEENPVERAIAKQALSLAQKNIDHHSNQGTAEMDEEEDDLQLLDRMRNTTQQFREYIRRYPFLDHVFGLLESWMHGNKAFLILATLPLFAIGTRLAFRHRRYLPHYNLTEQLFVQAYIACQMLLISIILVFLHGSASVDDIYELSIFGTFVVYWIDYLQLYRLPWRRALQRTITMFLYSSLIILLIAILIVALLTSFALLLRS